VIGTFNTCLRGPTHRSLTDTSGGYNLRGAGFAHHTPRPSRPTVLRFPPKGPPGLRLSIQSLPTELQKKQTLNFVSGSLHLISTAVYHLNIALLTVSHQNLGVTRINWKVDYSATMVSYNSYQLNAQSTKTSSKI
jgi:hypothetical protein